VLLRYATSPKLVRQVIELLGPDVRLYWDQAVCKQAGATSDVPWHQDNGYLPVEPADYLTCTVAIDATTVANGCLWVQPSSHRDGPRAHRASDLFFQVGYDGAETGVPIEQREGEVLAFSSLLLHRTGPNTTDRPRRSWVIQFCHGHARNRATGSPFTDRLLVARAGAALETPYRERPFDFAGLVRHAARNLVGRAG
jgi:ectoine hydroxylase-related dioxygenase (phytanoyl-CoA dioxygenase family)